MQGSSDGEVCCIASSAGAEIVIFAGEMIVAYTHLVTQKDGNYLLLCGERRYLAAQKLKLETIPARIVNTVTQKDEILAMQLTENLQREDLNPIDQAKGILAYIQAKHPDVVYNLDEVMSDLVNYDRSSKYITEGFSATVAEILKISAKSTKTLFNTLSLLKLVPKIQDVISAGKLPVSQGYLFAANLANPNFFTIFDEVMEKPVTNAKLENMLTAYKNNKNLSSGAVAGGKTNNKPVSIKKKVAVLQNAKTYFEKKTGIYSASDLKTYLEGLKTLTSFIEQQIEASEAGAAKPIKRPVAPS